MPYPLHRGTKTYQLLKNWGLKEDQLFTNLLKKSQHDDLRTAILHSQKKLLLEIFKKIIFLDS